MVVMGDQNKKVINVLELKIEYKNTIQYGMKYKSTDDLAIWKF